MGRTARDVDHRLVGNDLIEPLGAGRVRVRGNHAAVRGTRAYTAAEGAAAAVPEPGTIAMLLGGLAGLAVAVRHRRAA